MSIQNMAYIVLLFGLSLGPLRAETTCQSSLNFIDNLSDEHYSRFKKPPPPKLQRLQRRIKKDLLKGRIYYTTHASSRIHQRQLSKEDIEAVLEHSHWEKGRDKFLNGRWHYCIIGMVRGRTLRVILSVENDLLLIVTVKDKGISR